MKNPVIKLISIINILLLCIALTVFFLFKRAEKDVAAAETPSVSEDVSEEEVAAVSENDASAGTVGMNVSDGASVAAESSAGHASAGKNADSAKAEVAAASQQPAAGTKPAAGPKPAAVPADRQITEEKAKPAAGDASAAAGEGGASDPAKSAAASANRQAGSTPAATAAASGRGNAPGIFSGGSDSYQYFEYQVITVPKQTLAAAAESMGLPKDSQPSDELLPAIYKEGGYRVIGFSSGYAAASAPVDFKMSRTEFFPDFYILPQGAQMESGEANETPQDAAEGDNDADDGEEDEEDEADEADVEEDDGSEEFMNSFNNLASIMPFFGDPSITGNEFFLDIRPPRFFILESTLRKLNGFANTGYGDWGVGQAPIFDDNSFSNTLTSTQGKPMIIAKASSSNAWTLHVFLTKDLPLPEKFTPAVGSENKLVRLDFQIARVKWNELCAAGETDGCPAVPSDRILEKLTAAGNQLRDIYSPSFRLVPSQEPVSIQLNARTQFVPLKWIPAQDPGIPAIPLNSEALWTGTSLRAAARILDDGGTVRLDYSFDKVSQTGWRNYGYSFYSEPEQPTIVVQQDRYARPQQTLLEPAIETGLLKLPMLDTTSFRQALYLEVGKPVLAARISNPAYQPDMLTLLFVTATVEDAP